MLLRYALKSTRVMVEFGVAGVIGLFGILLLFSTVSRWRYESTLLEAIQGAATGEGDARVAFDEAIAMRPDDPTPSMLLGQWLLVRGQRQLSDANLPASSPEQRESGVKAATRLLQAAEKEFDAAVRKAKDWTGSVDADAAVVGAVASRLSLADASPEQRAALVDEASKMLEGVATSDSPEVAIAKVGLALARGEIPGAQKAAAEASGKVAGAGRWAVASYYWNHGLAMAASRDPDGWLELERAALIRRCGESGRMLGLATRIACADPAISSKPEVLAVRCATALRMLRSRAKEGSRFFMDRDTEAKTFNAVGIGFFRVPDYDKALDAFRAGESLFPKETTFKINRAMTFRAQADHAPETEKDPDHWKNENLIAAGGALTEAAGTLEKDPDRESLARDLCVMAGGLRWAGHSPVDAIMPFNVAKERYHLEEVEYDRNVGALNDWQGRLDLATPLYKKAIELHHRDSAQIASRIDEYSRTGAR